MCISEQPFDREKAKFYLDYIDKEMTFTGVVTSFSAGGILLIANKTLSENSYLHNYYCLISIILAAIATLLLLTHRSKLAFSYGQISLEIYTEDFSINTLDHWLKEMDTWSFWYRYFLAVNLIVCAFISFILFAFTNNNAIPFSECLKVQSILIMIVLVLVVFIVQCAYIFYLHKKFPNNHFVRVRNNQ